MAGAHRGAQRLVGLSCFGIDERGAQDVGQAHDELCRRLAEGACLARALGLPEMRQDARHGVAVDDIAVERELLADRREHPMYARVFRFADPRGGLGP
jgi:hypothetical protein